MRFGDIGSRYEWDFVILEVYMNEICDIRSRYESLYISTLCGGHWQIRNKLLYCIKANSGDNY